MNLSKQNMRGVTLIELMVTLAILAIILMMAIPSFNEFRQRSALRGASDQVESFWTDTRYEALKRNQMVKVSMSVSGDNYCFGANTTISATDSTKCNCFTAGSCNVARYPASQSEWKSVRFFGDSNTTIGNSTGVIIIDPKRAGLASTNQIGFWTLASPAGGVDYRLNINVDRFGRVVVCEPSNAGNKMPQFTKRRCL